VSAHSPTHDFASADDTACPAARRVIGALHTKAIHTAITTVRASVLYMIELLCAGLTGLGTGSMRDPVDIRAAIRTTTLVIV
jgi:hypothetical protein